MIWQEQLKNVKTVLKKGKLRDILWYLWTYYKWQILTPLCIVGIIGSIIYSNLTTENYVLQGIFLNTTGSTEAGEALEQQFRDCASFDVEGGDILFDTGYYISANENTSASYEILQIMIARLAAGEIDFVVGDLDTMSHLASNQFFRDPLVLIDLSTCDELQQLYMDTGNTYAFAFVENSLNPENAQLFLDYLMETDNE